MRDDLSALEYTLSIFAEVLGDRAALLGTGDTFDTIGLDSFTNLSIVARLEQDLGELPVTLLFEHQTIDEVATYLAEHLSPLQQLPARSARPHPKPTPSHDDAVAVVGVSGIYPDADDMAAFWQRLAQGAVSFEEIPADRWNWRDHFDERRSQPNSSYSRWGSFLRDIDKFDAAHFRILPQDAEHMDPQQRLFLETTWRLLESTGYLGTSGKVTDTGVFVGSMYHTYGRMGAGGWRWGDMTGPDSASWSIANRVSHFFDFRAPSFTVDSACSSSLLAVHLASESIRRGECSMAIAGGVNLILHPAHFVSLSALGMLSRDGVCRVFDERADGFVPGEGVGAVLLKPLRRAVSDGDRIWAIIRASHVNNDGRTAGYTVPNPIAQSELVAETYRRAGVDPRTISYIEAHGTGTALGDPIEIAGLRRAFTGADLPSGQCTIGSVKANIGHLEGAAGIAGLTKTLLQMTHEHIVPTPNVERENPKMELAGSPFRIARELTPWMRPTLEVEGELVTVPLRAGVSAFGAGGTNVHVLLEEYVGTATPGPVESPGEDHLVLLSAETPEQLTELADRLADQITLLGPEMTLAGVAYASQVGRAEMRRRWAIVVDDLDVLARQLRTIDHAGLRGDVGTNPARPSRLVPDLLARRKLAELGHLWTSGVPVDFRSLWTGRRPARVEFPAYPFDRRRYWFESPTGPIILAPTVTEQADGDGVCDLSPGAVQHELRAIVGEFLMLDADMVSPDTDLMEMGFDSISLIRFAEKVGDKYRIDLEVMVILDGPTLTQLGRHVIEQCGGHQ